MKVLLSILREMADIPTDPTVVAAAMDSLGMAVESVDVTGRPVDGVVTAKILRTEKHPDAAKVTRCWVDAGDGVERHVWCGATNMGPGDVVPLATLGTVMPDGREISRRGILGIESEGMLCSPVEIGIAQDSDGLLILDPSTPLGRDPFEVLGIEHDVVFDLDLTRNRPDCWGHMGVARDLAAHFKAQLRGPRLGPLAGDVSTAVPVRIDAPDACGMFSVWSVTGVKVTASPAWVVRRLGLLGMRSINNVVDASNLTMLETNQPNHAYDASVVTSFVIRTATPGESITTLDGVERRLDPDDLLVCDGVTGEPVGIAGVMGDAHSEITQATTAISLEIAWFAPDPVRFAAQRHGLRTEASIRFERGVDTHGQETAARRFLEILRETCPEAALHASATIETTSGLPVAPSISFTAAHASRVLGVSVATETVREVLASIGFTVEGDETLSVVPPSWRPDCTIAADLVEEVARHIGYDTVGKTMPKSPVHGRLSPFQIRRRVVRQVMSGLGVDEAMPSPFLAPGDLQRVGLDEDGTLRLANPLVAEESVLRTSLRPGLLSAVQKNLAHRLERVSLFEIGRVYPRGSGPLPDECEWLCVVVAGGEVETAVEQWVTLADALSVGALVDQARVPAGFHAGRSASLTRGKRVIGNVGQIDPVVLHRLGIGVPVSCLEVDLSVVLAENPKPAVARDVNRLPSSDLDLSFVAADSLAAQDLSRSLRQAAGKTLVSLVLFDVYRGEHVGEGRRSLTFRLRLQGASATLTDAEIAGVRDACVSAAAKLGAVLRA